MNLGTVTTAPRHGTRTCVNLDDWWYGSYRSLPRKFRFSCHNRSSCHHWQRAASLHFCACFSHEQASKWLSWFPSSIRIDARVIVLSTLSNIFDSCSRSAKIWLAELIPPAAMTDASLMLAVGALRKCLMGCFVGRGAAGRARCIVVTMRNRGARAKKMSWV
jgi:hypothetical protein